MYRYREIQQIAYGHYNDFVRAWQDLATICEKRGWPKPSVWTPTVGVGNETIVETDYRDLAAFQKASEAFESDAEAMKVYRGLAGVIVQGSSRSELLQQVTKPLA